MQVKHQEFKEINCDLSNRWPALKPFVHQLPSMVSGGVVGWKNDNGEKRFEKKPHHHRTLEMDGINNIKVFFKLEKFNNPVNCCHILDKTCKVYGQLKWK
ncbi:hypothetical protein CRENBAI_014240 [Crenichthys baileyi]|uniref:Uncharacterized protein n=1 Tax=Crenichthys baileyi TaxID=28760 RepID=A0AAV9SQ78_9TELE